MRALSFTTVLAVGLLSIIFYVIVNFILFHDFGFLQAGRVVFTTDFGYLDYLLLPLGILISAKAMKKRNAGASSRELFLFGFRTSLLASVLFSLFIFVCLEFSGPHYFSRLVGLVDQMKDSGRTLSFLEQEMVVRARVIASNALFQDPRFYAGGNFLVYLSLGTLTAIICGLFYGKRQAPR